MCKREGKKEKYSTARKGSIFSTRQRYNLEKKRQKISYIMVYMREVNIEERVGVRKKEKERKIAIEEKEVDFQQGKDTISKKRQKKS